MERIIYQEGLDEYNVIPPKYPDADGNMERTAYNPNIHPGQAYLTGMQFGAGRQELANIFGISVMTLDKWRRTYPEFKEAWQRGRDVYDGELMEKALRDLALGYSYEEKEFTRVKIPVNGNGRVRVDGNGNRLKFKYGMALTKTVKKRHKPDGKALVFWLTNRMKDRWQHIKTLEVTGQITQKRSLELIVELRLEQVRELNIEQLIELRSTVSRLAPPKPSDDRSGVGGEIT